MTVPSFTERLRKAELRPHTLVLGTDFQDLVDHLSVMPRTVFHLAWGTGAGAEQWLASARWPGDVLDFYRRLEEDERMEVLGVAGFHLHELVHRIDLLTTPFGVGFHGRACLEFVGWLNDSAEILPNLEVATDYQPMRDYPSLTDAYTVESGPAALQARVRYFDFLKGAPKRHVQPGWGADRSPFRLLGRDLHKVTVHQLTGSVTIPDGNNTYVRPITILESRALAVTALNLFHRLGADKWAAREVATYIRTYYEPRDEFPDYRFLLDLYAAAWGSENLPQAIEDNGPIWCEQALKVVMVLGWYALHAPPFRHDLEGTAAFSDSSPVVRLLVALRAFEEVLGRGKTYAAGVTLLNEIDVSERARGLGLQPVGDVLPFCLDWLASARRRNAEENSHTGLRAHFERIFDIQRHQIEQRLRWGYNSAFGIPDQGDLTPGFRTPADYDLMPEGPDTDLPPGVERWFALRENLLFRPVRPHGFWEEVGRYLTTMDATAVCSGCRQLVFAHDTLASHTGPWVFRCTCGQIFEVPDSDT